MSEINNELLKLASEIAFEYKGIWYRILRTTVNPGSERDLVTIFDETNSVYLSTQNSFELALYAIKDRHEN